MPTYPLLDAIFTVVEDRGKVFREVKRSWSKKLPENEVAKAQPAPPRFRIVRAWHAPLSGSVQGDWRGSNGIDFHQVCTHLRVLSFNSLDHQLSFACPSRRLWSVASHSLSNSLRGPILSSLPRPSLRHLAFADQDHASLPVHDYDQRLSQPTRVISDLSDSLTLKHL